jgi:S-disulfanyl-L-cysteine oxidoreductase SoxD
VRARPSPLPRRASRLAAASGFLLIVLTTASCGGDNGATAGSQDEQVAAGRDVYAEDCARCHGEQGEGGTGPVLVGGSRRIASYETTDRLYDYVSRTMPFDDAGSLSEDEYWSVIAYLLDENDLLSADTVLDGDTDLSLER